MRLLNKIEKDLGPKLRKFVIGVLFLLLVAGVFTSGFENRNVRADESQQLIQTLTTDKSDYYVGEPVNVTMTIANIGNQSASFLEWADTFDFLVYNASGNVYHWSNGRLFPFVMWSVTLDPGQNVTGTLTWSQTCNFGSGGTVSPGTYYVVWEGISGVPVTTPTEISIFRPVSIMAMKSIVGRGYNLPFEVSVTNLDDQPVALDVTVSSNSTLIETIENANMSGGTTSLQLTWNDSSFQLGYYNLSARVPNMSAGTSVVLTIPGDIIGDFKVELQDLAALAQAYDSKPGDSNWNPNADIDNNGVIGLSDLVILAQHYGQHYP